MKQLFIASFLALSLTACASSAGTSSTSDSTTPAASATSTAKTEKGLTKTYPASLADSKAAAVSALKVHGFEIKTETDTHIEGKRPNKIGLVVGSGGEKIVVDLTPAADGTTVIRVQTEKTFVGYAGQKNWDEPVQATISEKLGS